MPTSPRPPIVEASGARAAAPRGWAAMPFEQRAVVLRAAGDVLTVNAESW